MSKRRADPDAFALDAEVGGVLAADIEQDDTFTLAELERLATKVGREVDRLVDAGRTLDAQRLGVLFGILSDKAAKRRAEGEVPADDERRLAEAEARARAALEKLREREEKDPYSCLNVRRTLAERDQECHTLRERVLELEKEVLTAREDARENAAEAATASRNDPSSIEGVELPHGVDTNASRRISPTVQDRIGGLPR
jgi:hypothetical protein